MHHTANRLVAAQAIEILRIQKSRKENVAISGEVRSLREDITTRKEDIDNLREEVVVLWTRVGNIESEFAIHDVRLEPIITGWDGIGTTTEDISTNQKTMKDEVTRKLVAQQLEFQERSALIEKLSNDGADLVARLDIFEHRLSELDRLLQSTKAATADQKLLHELRARVDELVSAARANAEGQESISRVTDSFPRSVRPTLGLSSAISDSFISPMLQPVIQPNEVTQLDTYEELPEINELEPKPELTSLESQHLSTAKSGLGENVKAVQQYGAISNITHSLDKSTVHHRAHQEDVQEALREPQALASPISTGSDVLLQEASNPCTFLANTSHTPRDMASDRHALYQLLKLRQKNEQDLVRYYNDFAKVILMPPEGDEVERICVRRFVNGLSRKEEKDFLTEWLNTSEWSLRNTRDGVLLLSLTSEEGEVSVLSPASTRLQILKAEEAATGCEPRRTESQTLGPLAIDKSRIIRRKSPACISAERLSPQFSTGRRSMYAETPFRRAESIEMPPQHIQRPSTSPPEGPLNVHISTPSTPAEARKRSLNHVPSSPPDHTQWPVGRRLGMLLCYGEDVVSSDCSASAPPSPTTRILVARRSDAGSLADNTLGEDCRIRYRGIFEEWLKTGKKRKLGHRGRFGI
ncbi:hypothetical protein LTR05_007751 [Lithohypha guttulata]|uniref:Uncharacterized protein n=1 Tax=Lithohypha guttulata TaxID=1690604 RepID=A0AAN7SU56_9EURO|nr:hypothetical protein LTR05_007751 [Lithohypha guttulata]